MMFTVEEAVLISTFDYSSRTSAMLDIAEGQAKTTNQELQELCRSVIEKLARMTDAEFQATDFTVYEEVWHRGK